MAITGKFIAGIAKSFVLAAAPSGEIGVNLKIEYADYGQRKPNC